MKKEEGRRGKRRCVRKLKIRRTMGRRRKEKGRKERSRNGSR